MFAKPFFKISWLEKGICFCCLILLAFLPFLDLALRQFNRTIPDLKNIIGSLFLVAALFSAMITTKSGGHISITAIQYIKNEKVKRFLTFAGIIISIFLMTILAWNSVSFIKYNLTGSKIAFLTDRIFAAAMPLCFAVIAFRFAMGLKTKGEKIIAFSSIILGCAAALPAIAKIFWFFDPPEPFYSWVNFLYDAAIVINIPVIIFLVLAALAGMPVFAVIGGISMIMLMAAGQEPEEASIQIFRALTDTDIIAIPLFTITGFFLSESKAGERLVRVFRIFFGWLPGGIIIATVIICTFFTSFTGASGVTILALGGILLTILSQNKYTDRFSTGLLTSVGGIGLMFPPSLPIILVATTTNGILHFMNITIEHTIIDYFAGAVIPGIVLVVATIAAGFFLSRKVVISREKFSSKEALDSLKDSIFEILLPIILIAGYFSGFLTLLETAAVSVIYAVIIEVFVKKDISIRDISKVFSKAVPIIGGVLAILAMAKSLSYAFIDSGVPDSFSFWIQNAVSSKFVFLLLLNLSLLVLGCLMDIFSAILVFLPLVVPLGVVYGINPVHLGIIFLINLEAGFLTPPVGMNLFLASYRFNKPFMQICRDVSPFLIVRLAVVLMVTYLPWLTTSLLGLFN